MSAAATELEVRGMVERLAAYLEQSDIDDDLRGTATLAVGEALNNIVEHAYADSDPGRIHMIAHLLPDAIRITLQDYGQALPDDTPPAAMLPDSSGPRESLPEGGFGWFLIHKLSDSLTYNRKAGKNTLCLCFLRG